MGRDVKAVCKDTQTGRPRDRHLAGQTDEA